MSILTTDNTHWPLALAVAQGKPSIEQHMQALEDWNKWFAKEEPIHVLRFFDDGHALDIPPGAGKATQDWMAAGADNKIRTFIKSMTIVVPENQYERVKKMSITKVFGIPGGIFPSINDAFDWLKKQPNIDIFSLDETWRNEIQQTIKTLIE